MDIGGVAAIVLAAMTAVLLLALWTTTARHRRIDSRHAKARELRRQALVLDGRRERIRW